MRLGEAIEMAEDALERGLSGDEVVLVGRMVDAGKDGEEILEMLRAAAKPREDGGTDEDEGKTYRFEARGDRVVRIE